MPEYRKNDPFNEFKNDIEKHSKDHTMEFDPVDIKENAVVAAVCYITPLFFLPLILRPDSRFARFHANQGLLILIFASILKAIPKCTKYMPVPLFFPTLTSYVLSVVAFGFFLYGFIHALKGEARELPFFGGITLIR